ncbi:hypothetical protein [Marispirochaeta aestuarii]|uniref:hypothetical protein n=1 Tax=Marispirochaeta aestuarii TaxID=1963862 RepID=UPI0029C7323C|nr:hypothetical protein [Marispirochaeta aestuarii]
MKEQKVPLTVFALFFLFVCVMSAGAGGSVEEVHTSFKAGRGYRVGEQICFLLNYHLYRPKTGISRFPDGGIPVTVDQGVFEIRLNPTGEFDSRRIAENRVLDSELYSLEQKVFAPYEKDEGYDMNRTNQLVRDLSPALLGLPSPLDYCEKSRKEYIKDLVQLKGDFFYRKEIIRYLELSPGEAEEILRAMEEREEKLESYEQMEYRFISEDTKTEIRALLKTTLFPISCVVKISRGPHHLLPQEFAGATKSFLHDYGKNTTFLEVSIIKQGGLQ